MEISQVKEIIAKSEELAVIPEILTCRTATRTSTR
jgi:hypothetical protein